MMRQNSIDGKARENVVDMAIRRRREKVFLAAPERETKRAKYPKSGEDVDIIAYALSENIVFSHLKDRDTRDLIDYFEPATVPAKTHIITQGEEGDYFYVVKDGSFLVICDGKPVENLVIGSSFGEVALVYNSPRNATIVAEEDSDVWKIDRDTFREVLAKAHDKNSSSIIQVLKTNELTKQLSEGDIGKLAEVGVEVEYTRGQTILKKGEEGTLAYLIVRGRVRVSDLPGNVPDVELGPGEHFGELALLEDQARQATVIAATDVKVAAFSTEELKTILGPLKEAVRRSHQKRKLKSTHLFGNFSDEMLSSLLSAMKPKTFSEGDKIIRQGDTGTTFFLLEEGQCRVVVTEQDGSSKVISTLSEMSCFGEMALLTDTPRAADVIATSKCKVLEVGQSTFRRMFGTSAGFSRQLRAIAEGRRASMDMIQSNVGKIKMDQFDTIQILGAGTFGRVSLVKDKKNGVYYALKAMTIQFIERHKQESNVVGEKEAMLRCDHPFILKLYSTFKDSHRIYMLIEFCNGGELFNVLHTEDHDSVPESQAKFYAACELLALEHLAIKSMAYRDLKPENTLVDSDGYCKMIDLGFAKIIERKSYTFCGTPEYMAPEIILASGHTRAVDCFALGILIYEMICGVTPFYDDDQDSIFRNIIRGRIRFPSKMSEPAKSLVRKLLVADPAKRIGMLKGGMADIINDEWFADINFDELIEKKIAAPWKPAPKDLTGNSSDVRDERPIDESYESHAFWLDSF